MAQEASSSSQTLESSLPHDHPQQPQLNSPDHDNPSLTRNVSSSRLNAKAPEFVPRITPAASSSSTTTTSVTSRSDLSQPRLVISPPPPSQGIIHVYPSPNSPFHAPIPTHVPVSVPVQNLHHHHHVPLQYHHHQHHNHNHQRPFNGFLDQKDVSIQPQRIAHGDPDSKDGLADEATQKILNQVEYYFSDINLATTDHLMRFINKDPEGYVPISVVVSFKKIKALVSSNSQLASILRNSAKLVVSEDGKKVKRQHLLTESDMEELQSRIIVAENLPEDHCHQNLMKVFSTVGSVKTIRTCQPQTSNGGASSASRTAKTDGMLFSNKLHAFVEYESIELAEKAVVELNKEGSWRNGLRVRLLRRPSQAKRGKKAGQEDDKEDDTSTSEQHQPNEKHLEETYQQSDVQSHEQAGQGEEESNEKEVGGHNNNTHNNKKGRNHRGSGSGSGSSRGKGRGRGHQYNRGGAGAGAVSTSSVTSELHPKQPQPPGPRMPDGTRGFSMGRGKTVPVNTSSILL